MRLEIAAAGEDHYALRRIARNLLRMAQIEDGMTALPAIMALADRLDGRPAQESMVTVSKHDACDWTREELLEFLSEGAKVIEAVPNDAASEAPPSQMRRRSMPADSRK